MALRQFLRYLSAVFFIYSTAANPQSPDISILLGSGGQYASPDKRESMQVRQHSAADATDLQAIAAAVTNIELPAGADVVSSTPRGVGPATLLATVFKHRGEDRILSVSVATRDGGGALSLAHSIDPTLPGAAKRMSDAGASLLMSALNGESLQLSHVKSGSDQNHLDEHVTPATQVAPRSTSHSPSVERVVFDLDYQYGVGGAAYPVYKLVVLFRDGTACQCLESAIDDINVAAVRSASPNRVGTWNKVGADYEVRWTGVAKAETLKASVGPPRELPGASALRGQYQNLSGGGNTAFGGDVIAATATGLTFHSDGSFSQSNAKAMQSDAGVASGDANRSGDWTLNGSTLTLAYGDGSSLRTTLYYSANRKPTANFGRYGVIWIGGEGFKRIK